jgi:hypothetical protein
LRNEKTKKGRKEETKKRRNEEGACETMKR